MKTYEEKYKKALEWMREVYPTLQGAAKEDAEYYFPELKENNEEKIRNFISNELACLRATCGKDSDRYEELTNAIAWVEAQGEHANFRNKIQVGDKVTRNRDGMLVNLSQLKRVAKPAEKYNITGIGSKHAQGKLGEMIKNLKPAWSEEDEKLLGKCLDAASGYYSPEDKQSMKDWLKSLKDRVQPQKKWTPNEEQIEALVSAIDVMIDNRGAGDKNTILLSGLYHELKTL